MTALRDLRTARGLSMDAVGKELGVSRQAVFQWETGDTWPATPLLPKLAQVLGCSIDDLFAGDQGDYNKKESA